MADLFTIFTESGKTSNQFILSCLLLTIGYCLYWFLSHNDNFLSILSKTSHGSCQKVTISRFLGFFLLGLIPLLLVIISDSLAVSATGLNLKWNHSGWTWLMILAPVIVLINFLSSKNEANLNQYPQIRDKKWTNKTLFIEYSGWAFYLLGYEYLFRGVFLFGTIPLIGVAGAIALNAAVSTLAHIPKGWKETLGSFILGFFLSYVTLQLGSIWFAFGIHLVIAWSNSIFSFLAHPDIKYDTGK
ncbi:MAG: CPBP family intramembrane metalloprotease [Bacteroidetes bacterium]|nr:CPBP family intramembrane metalloprotease [Bacteroidota bacterium]